MNSQFRKLALQKIAQNAGILSQLVSYSLNLSKSTEKPKFKTLGSVGPGTTVMLSDRAVKPDGSVDIIINIRGIAGGDIKTASSLGVNAVIVTAEAGGIGSKENQMQFGNANFINKTVSTILSNLKQQFPDKNIHRGKLVVSGFSGGGGAIAQMLTEKNKVNGGINAVIINDGLHANPGSNAMQAVIDYARQAQKNPDQYKFELIHSAVNPGKYISTTETANYVAKSLGLQRQPTQEWSGVGPKPITQANQGGVTITQLYDKEQPYMAKDPKTGQIRPNVIGETSGGQHISSLQWMPNAFKNLGLS